jgi:hypothetical protein
VCLCLCGVGLGWVRGGWELELLQLRWGRRVALRRLSQCRGSRDMDAMGFWRLVGA